MKPRQIEGLFLLVILFLICFLIVHGIRLAMIGLRSLRLKPPEEAKPKQKEPEQIYYLVERKKKRSRKQYTEPKQIDFK